MVLDERASPIFWMKKDPPISGTRVLESWVKRPSGPTKVGLLTIRLLAGSSPNHWTRQLLDVSFSTMIPTAGILAWSLGLTRPTQYTPDGSRSALM